MQALADAASAYAQSDVILQEPHADITNAQEGLLMMEDDLIASTQLPEWTKTNPAYPVFGSTVKDKDNLFARCHGTVVGKAEWRTTGLFVSDVRFVFPSTAHCQAYYQAAMVGHPELFFDADDGSMQPRMVEMQSPDKSFHVGDICRTFCGPTALAREKLMASVAAGKTMEELQLIAERAIKTVHLLYLFCVGRIMVKLCVTTDNGLYPLGYAQALSTKCRDLSEKWSRIAGAVSAPASQPISSAAAVYAKSDLKSRLQERAKLNVAEAVTSHDKDLHAQRGPMESAYFPVALFVAVVGEGALDSNTPPRVLERLQQACSKVPKEQIIRIVLRVKSGSSKSPSLRPGDKGKDGKEVEVKLRVFVANSEDAKAVQTYIASHDNQTPAPVVVLFPTLPMAMEYDALTVDPTNQGTADRLRKQAKTRAVKLVRELLIENSEKLSSRLLFGHAGPSAPVKLLADSLKKRTAIINPDTNERGIVYTAGCKPVSYSTFVGHTAAAVAKTGMDHEYEEDGDDDEEEDEEDEEDDDEAEEDEGDYEQGLEGLLALASKALQDAAASSASSTPAAIAASGQWQEGAARAAANGEIDSGEGGGTVGLGKRRKPPVEIDEGQPGNVAQAQV